MKNLKNILNENFDEDEVLNEATSIKINLPNIYNKIKL